MWRSFFFAVGIGLMVLGAEALVFERIDIAQSTPVPEFLNKLLQQTDSNGVVLAPAAPQQPFSPSNANVNTNPLASQFNGGVSNPFNGSQFGPSRFSGPSAGGYGGQRVDLSRSGLVTNNNRSFGTEAYPVSFANPVANQGTANNSPFAAAPTSLTGRQAMVVKDWMPWSLLAAGAIIFLYTSSHPGSRDA